MADLYGKIDNGVVVEITPKPRWFYDDGSIVTDEYLISESVYPVFDDTIPEDFELYQGLKYKVSINNKEELIIDEVDKVIKNLYVYTVKSVDEVYEGVKKEIDEVRDINIYKDVEYQFPSGIGYIQIRNEIDLRNISSSGMAALSDVVSGNTTSTHVFLDRDNILREMTSQEMVNMSLFVKTRCQDIYSTSWNHKHVNLKGIYEDALLSDSEKISQMLSYEYNF